MALVIKRSKAASSADLVKAIDKLIPLLAAQKEDEAIADLQEASKTLNSSEPSSAEHKAAVAKVIECFEGDHELNAYTFTRETEQWTEVEELSNASSRVLALARRMK